MKQSIRAILLSAALLVTLPVAALAENVPVGSVNCDTAQDDISQLQHEKKSTDERIAKGVFSIMPIGIALNAADSVASSGDTQEMEINAYNQKLTDRIAEIKKACNID